MNRHETDPDDAACAKSAAAGADSRERPRSASPGKRV
jgi:hypothetical protein